jgi:threonine synthase
MTSCTASPFAATTCEQSSTRSVLACVACGWQPAVDTRDPFVCAHAGQGDGDHLLEHRLAGDAVLDRHDSANPFVRWRETLYAWHAARARSWTDAEFVSLVQRLDDAIARVDGHGFAITPFGAEAALSQRLGLDLWVKDETHNVAGSHKARHLMGVLLYLAVVEGGPGLAPAAGAHAPLAPLAPLAIASCGNAALAAAVLARAAGRALQVYVPPDAERAVLDRLAELGATVVVCDREPGEVGDPCMRHFRQALARGALPFCCQGSQNGLTIDGGQTLVLEMLGAGAPPLDHLVIQVGGGALASACVQAYARAQSRGLVHGAPRVHVVQTQGAAPLARAWARVQERMAAQSETAAAALAYAANHRSQFMWPWEQPPHSVASGILDDETYDWLAILRGVAATGGSTVVVDDDTLRAANRLVIETTAIHPSHTGSAGLAGLLQLQRQGLVVRGARVGVLLTGVQR